MSTVIETDEQPGTRPERRPTGRSVLMCRPEHFTVVYRINPWMNPAEPTDTSLALAQWQVLYDTYLGLGYDVQLIDPIAGLPDMVYAANGGFVIDNIAYGAKFTHPERQPEGPAYMDWFRAAGFDVREPEEVNEGEGDFLLVGDTILAGTGFRSRLALAPGARAHLRARRRDAPARRPELLPPRHRRRRARRRPRGRSTSPTCRAAFDAASLAVLQERYPDAILVNETDAAVLGLNSFSDGYNVVIASRATDFERQLREHGYNPIGVDLSELLLGGGGVKCCTLELRR